MVMEYVYMAMFLQEVGKEINGENIRKIFAALGMEADDAKVQFFIPALSILAATNQKKTKDPAETSFYQKLGRFQKQFDAVENSMAAIDERLRKDDSQQSAVSKDCTDNKKTVEKNEKKVVENEKAAKKIVEKAAEKTPEKPPENATEKAAEMIVEMVDKKVDKKLVDASEIEQKSVADSIIRIESTENSREETALHHEMIHDLPARYVYGVADKGVSIYLEAKGIEGALVYTIPYKEICVVVHDCLAEPYKSDDDAVVKEWLFTQQEVLDAITEKFGVVLPMSFDMIIEGNNGQEPEQTVKEWLEKNYENFMEKMSGLKGKQEFGVQVILDTEILSTKLIETDERLLEKKKEIDKKPEGIAYMERELLKDLLKQKIEEEADQYFREFFSRIRKCTDDIVIGKAKKVGGNKQMLMNLSCLVRKDRVEELGNELEKIDKIDGIAVRFSGPWAPYSFVTPEKGVARNG